MQEFITNASTFVYDCFLYDLFYFLSFVVIFFFYLWRGKKFGISPLKSVVLVLIVYPSVILWIFIQYWLETGSFGGNNIVRGFVYMPLIAIPAAKLLKLSWKQSCDLLSPAVCLGYCVGHLGCIFGGCCHGYPSSWGIYNPDLGYVCFPSPLFESLTAATIVGFLLWREKKINNQVDGLSMPIMLMLYGATRFIWEFFRDNKKIWMGCSALSFHALFMSIVGLIMYMIIRKLNNQQR